MGQNVIVKLKSDIESQGEIQLAVRELSKLCGDVVVKPASGEEIAGLVSGKVELDEIPGSYLITECEAKPETLDRLAYGDWFVVGNGDRVTPQQSLIEQATIQSVGGRSGNKTARRHREYLSHGIHRYIAKFFPRFARALINICQPTGEGTVLDPFSGSGTTGLEASLMGLHSVSSDIDPLSCLISKSKVQFPLTPLSDLDAVAEVIRPKGSIKQGSLFESSNGNGSGFHYKIPHFLRIKLDPAIATEIEQDVDSFAARVASIESESARRIGRLLISHAVSMKIWLRWVGTGDNRFALEIGARDVFSIANSHLKRLRLNHPEVIGLTLPAQVIEALETARYINASADSVGIPDESVTAVVTSPPYLPASSGRETYLRSRAPGLMALELLSEKEIHDLDASKIIGSVLREHRQNDINAPLPGAVTDLVEWMRPQRARAPKAEPTLVYFHDLRRVGKEMHRVLKSGGTMAMVVATAHTFYELESREVLQRFPLAEILAEFFTERKYGVGFSSAELIEIELPKMNYKARPGAKHQYSETALLFRK